MLDFRGKGLFAGEHSRKFEGADRKTSGSLVHLAFERLRLSSRSMGYARSPNKAPEPTSGSVTPRAIVRANELKQPNVNRHAARGAPAPAVAHSVTLGSSAPFGQPGSEMILKKKKDRP